MITKIKKRDGREAPFNIEKIGSAIFKAAAATGGKDYDTAMALAEQVAHHLVNNRGTKVPTVEEIQDAVEKILIETGHARTAKEFILYRAERTRVREMDTRLMRVFEDLTFKDAQENDLKRENANIDGDTAMGTMLKYGSEGAKQFYEMFVLKPPHAAAHKAGDIHIHDLDFLTLTTTCQNDQHGGQSIPNFDYGMAPGVAKTFVRLYRQNMDKALGLLADWEDAGTRVRQMMDSIQNTHGIQPQLEALAPYQALEKAALSEAGVPDELIERIQAFAAQRTLAETERITYQAMEAFVHNLNTMHSRAGAQIPFSSINYGTDTSAEGRMVTRNLLLATESGLGNGETPIFPIHIFRVKEGLNYNPGETNYDLFQLACRVSAKRLFPNFAFLDAPFNLKYYEPGKPETEVAYMGCRTRVIGNIHDDSREITYGRGNLSFTTLNLPRLALESAGNLPAFYELLDERIELIVSQLYERYQIQAAKKVKNFPFLMGQGIWMDSDKLGWEDEIREVLKHGTLSMGFIGLAETLKALTGAHHGESPEAQALGLEIISRLRSRMDEASTRFGLNFTLIATPAEGTAGRFVGMDRKRFGTLEGITDREYYTNSFHVPVYHKTTAYGKIQLEAPYHALTNAGHITYVELDGDPVNNLGAFEKVVRAMKESGIGYGSINHPIDRDPVCGYTGVIGETCPACGREEGNARFERIRRITGYLVGTLDRFNNAKQAEERDRVKHF